MCKCRLPSLLLILCMLFSAFVLASCEKNGEAAETDSETTAPAVTTGSEQSSVRRFKITRFIRSVMARMTGPSIPKIVLIDTCQTRKKNGKPAQRYGQSSPS